MKSFVKELVQEVAIRNPKDYTTKRIPIGSDIVPIDSTKIPNFLSLYNPVLFEDLEEDVSAYTFLKGKTDSFKPFSLNWHFRRKEIKDVVGSILKKKDDSSQIVIIEGTMGSGRTFLILAVVHELIKKYRAIAIKIPSYALNKIPSSEELNEFLKEVLRASKELGIAGPERVIFWAEFPLDNVDVSQFKKIPFDCEYSTCLLFEDFDTSHLTGNKPENGSQIVINLDVELSEEHKENLAQYILDVTRSHRFPEIDEEEARRIIKEEEKFLPIMYRTLDPTRRSINAIVQEVFNELDDSDVQACVSLCALATSIDLEMPVAILKKALGRHIGLFLDYPDVFEIATDKAKAFIKYSEDLRTNPLLSIYHPLIAQYIVRLVGTNKMDEYLLSIAETADLRSKVEADFVSNLLIVKGVNWIPGKFKPFTDEGLETAFVELKNRQPARPILHHLARLYEKKYASDDRIISLLTEAIAEPKESYAIDERKENILTTLGKIKWRQNKHRLLSQPRNNPEIREIIDILVKARESTIYNIHPYDVHARILKELWQFKDEEEKMALVIEAVEVINEAMELSVDDPDSKQRLEELLIESLSEIDPEKAEITAKDLLENKNDGTGYYTLARIEYHKKLNAPKASVFLDKAMKGDNCPPSAIALKIEIILQDDYPVYKYLVKLADRLSSDIRFKETWKSAYNKSVIYTIDGRYRDADSYSKLSYRMAPRTLQRKVQVFWMENGHRKVHTGKIGRILTEREGRIYSHNIEGWKDDIFFDPRPQDKRKLLRQGMFVEFELGFSPRGPQAFDVRPFRRT